MAELFCNAENCTYNEHHLCCKGDIAVGGSGAIHSDETCCESFSCRREDAYQSSLSHPSRTIDIDCEAVKCIYNEDYHCTAAHVDIKGCGASGCRETSCGTFQEL